MRSIRTAAASCIALLSLVGTQAAAEPVYGIASLGSIAALVAFDSTTPGSMTLGAPISGLVSGQTLRSIDFRPANGLLYAVSTNGTTAGQLYTLNLTTGALSTVGAGFSLSGNTGHGTLDATVSIDFNPVADRLRIVTGSGQSYRVNPINGTLAGTDTSLSDPFADVSALAYSNNVAGALTTTLYGYNYTTDELVTIGGVNGSPSPNAGQVFVVGDSTLGAIITSGMDISGVTGIAYASIYDAFGPGTDGFYSINLTTGAFTLIGTEAFTLLDFAVQTAAVAAVPEPDSLAMLGLGVAALAFTLRRRTKRA